MIGYERDIIITHKQELGKINQHAILTYNCRNLGILPFTVHDVINKVRESRDIFCTKGEWAKTITKRPLPLNV